MPTPSEAPSDDGKMPRNIASITETDGSNCNRQLNAIIESDSEVDEVREEFADDNMTVTRYFTKAAMTAGLNGFSDMMRDITALLDAKREVAEQKKEAFIVQAALLKQLTEALTVEAALKKQLTEALIAEAALKKQQTEALIAEEALVKREHELLLARIEAVKRGTPLEPPAAAPSFGLEQHMHTHSLPAIVSPSISGVSTQVSVSSGAPGISPACGLSPCAL